jgi:hypothetical protein
LHNLIFADSFLYGDFSQSFLNILFNGRNIEAAFVGARDIKLPASGVLVALKEDGKLKSLCLKGGYGGFEGFALEIAYPAAL